MTERTDNLAADDVLISPEEAIKQAVEGVKLARTFADEVEFSAEDASRTDYGYLREMLQACFEAGAGRIGNYDQCCWQVRGQGQFRPLAGSSPAIGEHGELEREEQGGGEGRPHTVVDLGGQGEVDVEGAALHTPAEVGVEGESESVGAPGLAADPQTAAAEQGRAVPLGVGQGGPVRVHGHVNDEQLEQLVTGVELDDGFARFEEIVDSGGEGSNHWYHVVIMEGRKREVRRLWEAIGVQVNRLKRVRFGPLFLNSAVKAGQWRSLNREELRQLSALTEISREQLAVTSTWHHADLIGSPYTRPY